MCIVHFILRKLHSQSCGIISTTQNVVPKGASKYQAQNEIWNTMCEENKENLRSI